MSHPRCIIPRTTYLLTRRVTQRRFRLLPHETTCVIVIYCLAVVARALGIAVHAFVVMGNHVHLVVTDEQGRLPIFHHIFYWLTTLALNAEKGHSDNFWDTRNPHALPLEDKNAVLSAIAYTMANPVAAGLCGSPDEWPGWVSTPALCEAGAAGGSIRPRRPASMPIRSLACVGLDLLPFRPVLRLTPPPSLSHLTPKQYRSTLERALQTKLACLRQQGISFERLPLRCVRSLVYDFAPRAADRAQTRQQRPATPETTTPNVDGEIAEPASGPRRRRSKPLSPTYRKFLLAHAYGATLFAEPGTRHLAAVPLGTWALVQQHNVRTAPLEDLFSDWRLADLCNSVGPPRLAGRDAALGVLASISQTVGSTM